ncbi:hypothetical protein QKW35_19095 [Pontibacterium granulatum]|uniref:hypothetical protein n=1 Tax=Pontibacterium granulatum TaxID=2036029 RepID=UPI00249BCE7D|nr:hypothetical protein [Pontibacterium granulatum]MDI3326491.1 hypothetical protein [Pontibacterium granulatum]
MEQGVLICMKRFGHFGVEMFGAIYSMSSGFKCEFFGFYHLAVGCMESSNTVRAGFEGVASVEESGLQMPQVSSDGGETKSEKDAVTDVTPQSSAKDHTEAFYSTWVRRSY